MGRVLTVLFLAVIVLGVSHPAQAESEILVEEPVVRYNFGAQVTIETHLKSETPIENIRVILLSEGDTETIIQPLTSRVGDTLIHHIDLTQNYLRAFSDIEYWFQFELAENDWIDSKHFTFYYEDNRFDWQTVTTAPFTLHWLDGNFDFTERVLTSAREGLERIQSLVPVPDPESIDVYAYNSAPDLQTALQLTGQVKSWVAGHAAPDLGVILVSLPIGPSQNMEIKRQVPHELAHVMLYSWLGDDYRFLPQWLNEGLASSAEIFPNPDYQYLLEKAYAEDRLLTVNSLCDRFPQDASNFLLAYAVASDFTWYLHQTYGNDGLRDLTLAYAGGLGCNAGVEQALGKSLTQIEREWRADTFGENIALLALEGLAPWIVVLAAVLSAPLVLLLTGFRKREAVD